ncbi:MAG: cytochrome c oxidase accessory protein CcoG [Bacteroidota bacterium]|nr:cytochrome c oxidase accessory protein CcoG [Bacteroidota bacterium]
MSNQENQSNFRDRLTTVNNEGKRAWVYAKEPKGILYRYRQIIAYSMILFLILAPFISLGGEQFILLNFLERKFVIFGIIFWPQDFHLFVMALISFIVFIVLFTVIYGRLFCGWVCPQTIFMEFVFRRIEWLIDGNYQQQRKLKEQAWNLKKITKRVVKHALFYLFALIITHSFLSYIIGVDQVKNLFIEGPGNNTGTFAGILVFSGIFYFIFAWFREQVCTITCPYGRLQGVMLDTNSMIVAYDYNRGEPRNVHNNNDPNSDCIDCRNCVTVCPTGIDIRNGTQLECINCTACIDACNSVMTRIKKPKGLIRIASEKSIREGTIHKLNVRAIAYTILLAILLAVVAFLFHIRTDIETTILRAPGTLYQETEVAYTNLYNIEIVNKTRKKFPVSIKIHDGKGKLQMIGGDLCALRGELVKGMFIILIDKEELSSSKNKVTLGVYSGEELIEEVPSTFVGPYSLDTY